MAFSTTIKGNLGQQERGTLRAVFPQGHGFPVDQALPAPQAEPCPDLAHTRPELTGSASGLGSASGAPEALPRSSLTWPDPAPALLPPAGWDTTPPPHGPCASTGPFLGGICSLGRPSPAKGPRSAGCWSQPCRAPQRGRRSGAARPGSGSGLLCCPNQLHQHCCPPSPHAELAGRPPGRQGWGWDLWSCHGSFLGAGQEGKPCGTLTRVVWGQPLHC